MDTYAEAAIQSRLPNPPSAIELKPAFKKAYRDRLAEYPCFREGTGDSGRKWWRGTVKRTLDIIGRTYSPAEFERFFRRVYQHYGSGDGYEILPDAEQFLRFLGEQKVSLGVCTNTPTRSIETVLPMLGLHKNFDWFVCCQDVGFEKPAPDIFDAVYKEAAFWCPGEPLERHEILHIGDSLAADFCGAKAAGFQAILLDRSDNSRVNAYQDWLVAPDYPGKSDEDLQKHTVKTFADVKRLLE